ncbi:uncharacterized protein LOC143201036 [Rhynchophorus ferrugineus]|uniref:uncharacterized protein LOC143201036 n=1 Tax=Rhynchophorus ferrugineus TaxID=354439 RepID=UPI003FCE4B3E
MKSFVCVAFFALLAYANAGVAVLPSAKIIQGPSTKTTVVGPDGSAISSIAPAGQIVQQESVGVVAQTAPILAAPALAYSAPTVLAAPALAAKSIIAPSVVARAAPVLSAPLVSGVVATSAVDTVVAGPSGTIATGKTLAAPVVAAW